MGQEKAVKEIKDSNRILKENHEWNKSCMKGYLTEYEEEQKKSKMAILVHETYVKELQRV